MLATTTLTTRRDALIAEREAHTARHLLRERQYADQITKLEVELARLRDTRAQSERQYAERDYGYGAVIGELDTLIALAADQTDEVRTDA
jgi:hypothetical protein